MSWYPVPKPSLPSFHGSKNTMRRDIRYGSDTTPTTPTATTKPATTAMVRAGTSPSHMTARMPMTQIIAVPRSDCLAKMSRIGARTSTKTWTKNARKVSAPSRRSANRRAPTSTSTILANSDG